MGYRLFLFAIGLALGTSQTAWSVVTLKQVQVSNGSQIDLLFDSKINKNQIRTEFFNDIIQLSLNDVSVYPAKISSVSGGGLTKVFAYQYAPKLIRCRLSVKGKAEDYKNKIEITPNGKILTIHLTSDHVDQIVASRAAPSALVAVTSKDIKDDEHALLEKVLQKPVSAAAPTVSTTPVHTEIQNETLTVTPLATGKPLPSMYRVFGRLAFVMILFCALAVAAKKFMTRPTGKNAGLTALLGKLMGNGLGREGKMIEVVATHYLGPKKSIAVIRVAGRTLVIGVTNDSINLITRLSGGPGEEEMDFEGETLETVEKSAPDPGLAGPAGFSSVLDGEKGKPDAQSIRRVRDQIRTKIEGMKPL